MADGFTLIVPKEMIDRLDVADRKIAQLADTAEKAQKRIGAAFNNMSTGGIDNFISKLNQLNQQIADFSKKNISLNLKFDATKAITEINKITDAISKTEGKNTSKKQVLKSDALFDLEELQAKRDRAVAIIKDLEGQVRALNTQYQAALTERGAVRDSIGGISKDEISELQQQINQLGQAMQQVGAGAGHSWRQSIQPYIDAINQLKDKIAQIKAEEEQLFKTDVAKANSKVSQLDSQYDGLYKTINGLLDEVDNLDKEMQSKIAANKAVEEQINKITEWKVKIKELENDFTRLNAAGKAFDSGGNLTTEGANLTNRKAQLEEELKLMQMNAAEAKRYSDSIIAQEQREAELVIREEQRTTNAKIAEYERLMREERRLKADYKIANKASSEGLDYNNSKQATADELNKVARERESLEIELGEKVSHIRQKYRVKDLKDELDAIEKSRKAREDANKKDNQTFSGAMAFSASADTLNKEKEAIKNLEIARGNLSKTDVDYTNKLKELNSAIDKHKQSIAEATGSSKKLSEAHDEMSEEMDDLSKKHSKLLDTSAQLQRKLALLFSVSAIQGYINKIVEVRKEFEYQQKSLQFLLQNKDAADKIWNESVALALKSPFRVKEIVTYTKQVAAYRIESDKLHDTTKRLADVASGIGVDMQRLILAYGQVRAAEFLRATELRQFTEAGIPLLEELANYYSAIEKKAVTTAEVFNRISKRQVLFADVEKVLKGLTSEGGMFYKMQEKQAETLHGQISNLHDQIDLMLNSIGNSNQRTIEGFINMARGFVSSWRTISDQIIMVGSVLTIARIAVIAFANANKLAKASTLAFNKGLSVNNKTLMLLSRQLKITQATAVGFSGVLRVGMVKASMAAVFAFQSLKAALTSFLPALVITAIMELVWWLVQADEKSKEFAEAVSSIHGEVGKELHDSIDLYRRLAEVVGDLTNTEAERVEALNKLKQVFGDILPDQYLEMKYVESLSGNYSEATEAMTEYYNSKVVSQKKAKVDEIYGGDITKNVTDLKEDFLDVLNDPKSAENIDDKWGEGTTELIKDGIGKAIEDATDAIKNGEFDATAEGFNQALEQSISKYTGKDISGLLSRVDLFKDGIDWETEGVVKNIREVVDGVKDWKTAMSGIEGFPDETAKTKANRKEMEQYEKALEDVKGKVQELKNAFSDYNRLKDKKPEDDATQEEKTSYEKQKKEIEDKIKSIYGDLSIDIPVNFDVSTIAESTHLITQETNRVEQESMNMFSMVAKMGAVLDWAKPTAVAEEWTYLFKNVAKGFMEMSDSGEYTGRIIKKEMDGSTTVLYDFSDKLKGKDGVNNLLLQMGENAKKSADMLDPTQIQVYTNGVIDSALRAAGLSEGLLSNFRAKADDSMQSFTTNFHNTAENFIQTYNWISAQLAATPLRMDVVLANNGLTLEQWEQQKKVVPVIQSLLKEFPKYDDFKPKKNKGRKGGKKEDPAKDAADIVEQVWDRYNDLVQNMSSADAIEEVRKYFEKDFAKAMKDAKVALELKNFDFSQYDNVVAALEKIKAKAKGETAEEIGKTIGDLKVDKQKKENKDAAEARDREIDQLFEMYELYKELEKINIPTDWAKSFFNIDATSLTDLRSQLEANKYRFVGEEGKEEYQKYLDKLSEMEQKEQEERLKTYLQYARDAVGERAKIKLEELKKLSEIEQAFQPLETDDEKVREQKERTKEIAMQKVKDESAQATKKLEWEEFQKSDMFLMIFEDLESASGTLMESTLKKLEDFKEQWADMPLEAVRAMTEKINQLESALLKLRNPFTAVGEINKSIEEILGGQTREQVNQEAWESQQKIDQNNIELGQLETIRDLLLEGKDITAEQRDTYTQMTDSTQENVETLNEEIKNRKDENKELNKSVTRARQLTKAEKDKINAYNAQADAYNNLNKMAKDLYDASKELVELFVDDDSIGMVFADMGMSMADSVLSTLSLQANLAATKVQLEAAGLSADSFAMKMNAAMGVVGWIVMGIQLITQALSAAFKAHDKAKQKKIDEEIKSIERLEKELEKLEERLETVYSLGGVNKSMRQVQANIDDQIQSYERMMRLEEQKKNADEEQIEEWKENIEELREKREELHKEMVESLGGNYDVRSVAREFVDAWIDAFKETGDGLKGLRDNFKDFFLNILLEQAVMQKVGSFFSDAMGYFNNIVLSDYLVTDAERKKTEGMFDEAMIKTNDYLNMLFGENGVLNKYIDDTDSSLSGLQQGIQGVTEETAQIIEAYLNSIRFYIAQDNQNLAKLVDTFTNVESPNPILNELRTQTELITSIRDLFRDVVRMGHPTYGGAFLKVAL